MFSRIIKLLEKYSSSVVGFSRGNVEIFENSSSNELAKLLKEFKVLRFSMNRNNNYVVWDGFNAFHTEVAYKLLEYKTDECLRGQITTEVGFENTQGMIKTHFRGVYLYVISATKFYNSTDRDSIIEEFNKTKLYSNLQKIDINNIEIGRSY